MNQRHVVAISLIYVFVLVAASRSWLGDMKNWVFQVTGQKATQ